MASRPTISDVAREAGVSRTTVSHALRGMGQVESGTRQRVIEAAERLGYRPSVRAQSLRLGRTRAIALMSSMPAAVSAGSSRLGFFMEVAASAAETALLHGYSVVLVPPIEAAPDPLSHLDVDGAVLVEPTLDDPLAEELRLRYLPYVSIGRHPGSDTPYVDLDSAGGVEMLLTHLRERGRRRIALVLGSARRQSYLETAAAYTAFCARTGQEPLVVPIDESLGEQGGYEYTVELLREHPDIDALCVVVDTFASGSLRALEEAGLRVPEDVMVVTRYDGLRAKLADPPLTSLDLHLSEVAAAAIHLLLAQLRNGPDAPGVVHAPRAGLVARASTGD